MSCFAIISFPLIILSPIRQLKSISRLRCVTHLVVISHIQTLQSVAMHSYFVCTYLRYILLLATITTVCYGRSFEKCKLARKLSTNGFSDTEIRTTLCYGRLSEYNNRVAVTIHNETFYGLFAIHEPWCASSGQDSPDSECNDYCSYMMDDHLRNDIKCLRKIYDGQGRWSAEFKQFYETNNLIDLKECEKTIVDDCSMAVESDTKQLSPFPQIEC